MDLIPAQKQQVWKWPAIANFSCGGIGTGFYLIGLLVALPGDGNWLQALTQGRDDWVSSLLLSAVLKLLGPAVVGLGLLALTTEAGRPRRGLNLLRHWRHSWMSRETIAAGLFVLLPGLDWLWPNPALRALAALAAIALVLSQGLIVYHARGVIAWNTPLMPLLFATSALATGGGLMLIALTLSQLWLGLLPVSPIVIVTLLAGALNMTAWFAFLRTPDRAFQQATAALRHRDAVAHIFGLGLLLPALLLSFAIIANPVGPWGAAAIVVSGLALIAAGIRMKFSVVLEAGYLRAIALPVLVRPAIGQDIHVTKPAGQ